MTGIITFEIKGGKSCHTGRGQHWNGVDWIAHEEMDFYDGWVKATELVESL